MRIEHVTKTHRIGGRMVMSKRPATVKGVQGFTVVLEGRRSAFYPKGENVEVTAVR